MGCARHSARPKSPLEQLDYLGIGKSISALAVGCWQAGGLHVTRGRSIGWGSVDPIEIVSTYQVLFEGGINVFDTADSYGPDLLSARRLAVFLRRIPRREYCLCLKVGYDENTKSLAWHNVRPRLQQVLSVLGVSNCDLFSLHHNGLTDEDFDLAIESLQEATKSGLASAVAVRVGHVPTFAGRDYEASHGSRLRTRDFLLAEASAASALLMSATNENIALKSEDRPVILNKTLGQGLWLRRSSRPLLFGDTRYGRPGFSPEDRQRILQLRKGYHLDNDILIRYLLFRAIAPGEGRLAFVGMRDTLQAKQLVAAARVGALSESETLRISSIIRSFPSV